MCLFTQIYSNDIMEGIKEVIYMPASKAQQKAVNKYMRANYDRVNLTLPKGRKEEVRTHAEQHGESVNAFISRAIDETISRDNDKEGS